MINFLRDDSCCSDTPGGNDPETRDCLDIWKQELVRVSAACIKKTSTTSKTEEEYLNSLGWQDKLKNWKEIIEGTDEKADTIVNELKFFLDQVIIVCNNSEVATAELEKLFGLIKCIFDSFYTYGNGNEGLKDLIINLKRAVECLKNTSDEDKAEVIACIETYEQKILLVCEMQDAILTKMLETFKCANLLCKAICGDGGLEDKIEGLQDIFKSTGGDQGGSDGDDDDDDDDDDKRKKSRKKKKGRDHGYEYPCDDSAIKPMPDFPLCESEYYMHISNDLDTATRKTKELKDIWVHSKELSDRCLSQKAGLEEAIEAAEAAEKA